ncbi:fibronectin-binding autotransporter adhesin [Terrimicrobium sacchariphilum]|uniref:Fibronectin-binding autotransporter adhesin n=1 Tax=Terrimicrobium sacchariphilum TaxID=690879 RepID=A0A146G5W0_TERSA|nr:autotransporter-associated beta strand repeat-containing protein [Terrimicrobium sacchariphilum]GAT32980.1 fibronectin-binding autotransporter adhesin [Terrimicrobium sacchariphilum]
MKPLSRSLHRTKKARRYASNLAFAISALAGLSSLSAQTNVWNGSGVAGGTAGTVWTDGANYSGGTANFTSSNDINFGVIGSAGTYSFSGTAGTYAVKDLLFGTTSSTITTSESITLNGTGTAGQTTLSLAGNVVVPSPNGSKAIISSDVTLNLSNAAHLVQFAANPNVTATVTQPGVLVLKSLVTGGGASSSIATQFSAYGPGLSTTPALVLSNDSNTFDSKITGSSRVYFTSIGNVGEVSSLGASTGANSVVGMAGGGIFGYIGSTSQSSNRAITVSGGSPLIANMASSTGTTLTLNGAMTFTNAASTLRLGATAGNSLVIDTVIANASGFTTGVTLMGGADRYDANGVYSSASLTGTTYLKGLNTYTGVTTLWGGMANVEQFGNINEASGLGKGSAAGSAADIVFAGGGIQHTAANTASTDRLFTISNFGSGTSATIDSSAANTAHTLSFTSSGAVSFSNSTTVHSLILTGTNTGRNVFNPSVGVNSGGQYTNSVTKSGTGTWVLSGSNTYTGATTVSGGTLVFANKSAKSSASTVTAAAGTFIGLGVGGSNDYSSADVDSLFANTLSGFTLNATTGVAIDTTAGNFTYATNQTSTRALSKIGANTLTLSGSGNYSSTLVHEGTLLINGNNGSGTVTVDAGATLGGSGTIGGAATIKGNLKPGNSPGEITFLNNLTLQSSATVTMEINGTSRGTTFDAVMVGNLLTYDGALVLNLGTTFGTGDYTFDLFSFGSTSGSFSSVVLAGSYSGTLTNSGGIWTLTQGNEIWSFSQTTGDLNLTVAVPEPGTFACLIVGLTTLVVLRRRKA